MKCKRVKTLLSGLLDESVSSQLQQELFEHMKQCPNCRKEYEELNSLNILIKTQMKEMPGKEYWDTYWKRLEKRFLEKAFRPKQSIFKRLKEIYLPYFPSINMQLSSVVVTVVFLVLISVVSFQLGRNTELSIDQLQQRLYSQEGFDIVLAKYKEQGYPDSVAKATIAQQLIKNFFGNIFTLYNKEGLDEFVVFISKNGITSPSSIAQDSEKYDTTIMIPDLGTGDDKIVIKAIAKHTL